RLAAGVVDISSQHAHHTLVDAATHLGFLDAFANLSDAREVVGREHAGLVAADAELTEVRSANRQRAEREDLLRFQLGEIDALGLSEEAVASWKEDALRLRHADALVRTASRAEEALYAADESLSDQIGAVLGELEDAADKDPSLLPVV